MEPAITPAPRGRRPPPGDLVERRRAEIVEAAFEVFKTRGYTNAGIADIAERLGIGHGTFYRYFKNKRDILDNVIDFGVERIVGALEFETANPATTLEEFRAQLRHLAERLFALLDEDPGLGGVMLFEATAIDEEMTQRVLGLFDTFGGLAAGFLQGGVSRGFLRPDLDVQSVGRALTSVTFPALVASLRGEAGPSERARYIDAMISMICDGVAAS
jgi:AcrR family transcriptional regulator